MLDLYDELVQGGETAIYELKVRHVQESVQLEFKRKARPGQPGLTKEDRQNLGIVLSALSNSMGGVVVWGVIAEKNGDQVDCASDLEPISHIERFKSEVERAVSQVLMPRHDGIRIEKVSSSTPGAGYLVMRVERSERRPHRNEAGERQYFKRVGDSNIAMEHYDIEDSFKRFVVPSLDVEFALSDGGTYSDSPSLTLPSWNFVTLIITLILVNRSQVSAAYPYLIIDEISQGLARIMHHA
jgi:hypothetical protein